LGISERREREKKARKNTIIEAAEVLFFSKGYDTTTVNDIMKRAELGKGTFYLYFISKEDLYHSVVLRGVEKLLPMFEEVSRSHAKGIDKVLRLGFTLLDFYKKYPDYFMLMTYDGYQGIANENTPTQKVLTDKSSRLMEITTQAIDTGIGDKTIRNDLDTKRIMYILMSTAQSLIRSSFPRNKDLQEYLGISAEEIFKEYYDLMFRALENHDKK